jgi:2-dehydro-3-deoxyphosphogluconate aldolase/(4S)-4-hydroxy-2-oxoglutarate aldolase
MKNEFNRARFDELPVVGILRGFGPEDVECLVESAARGGLKNIEITMNSPGAQALIRLASGVAGDCMNVGAGTVLDEAQLDAALDTGAGFIVTPVLNERVIRRCVEREIPIFPGAFTPTEIARAWGAGATMVKVFPADQLGPGYIKNLKAPLPHIALMPTGGVNLETLEAFVRAGASAAGVGSPLFHADRVRRKDWAWIESQCRAFAEGWKQAVSPG